jgi:uncharacterized protein YndB with AHSA1/START domain
MKWLKRALLALLILAVVFLCVGFLLPAHYRVERSMTINSKPETVYPIISDLKTWNKWTALNDRRYPDMKQNFSGSVAGTGAKMDWDGKSVGPGAIEITNSAPKDGIEYTLSMNNGQFQSNGAIKMKIVNGGVQVTWSDEGDIGMNPVNRYVALFLDHFVGSDFEQGLNNLKNATEVH